MLYNISSNDKGIFGCVGGRRININLERGDRRRAQNKGALGVELSHALGLQPHKTGITPSPPVLLASAVRYDRFIINFFFSL